MGRREFLRERRRSRPIVTKTSPNKKTSKRGEILMTGDGAGAPPGIPGTAKAAISSFSNRSMTFFDAVLK